MFLEKRLKQILAGILSIVIMLSSSMGIAMADGECTHSTTRLLGVKEATCETDGYSGDLACSECGKTIEYGKAIPASGHNISDYICVNCKEYFGYIRFSTHSQLTAGEEFKIDVILEKNPGFTSLKIAYEYDKSRMELISVENKGLLKGYMPSDTGYLIWDDDNRTSNNNETGVIATLTMKAKAGTYGTTSFSITEVNAVDINLNEKIFLKLEGTEVDVLCNHYWSTSEITKEATCEEDGIRTYICEYDNTHRCTEVIKKTGHTWNKGKITIEPTCEEEGEKTYTCKNNTEHIKTEKIKKLEHDYTIVELKEPTDTEDGYEKYKCTKCDDEYTEIIQKKESEEEKEEFEYDDLSGAASDSLTFYVGYFGMDYVEKKTLSLSEIQNNCEMITQTFSYITNRPRVVYDVATGPRFADVLYLAGIDIGDVDRYQFGTEDSNGNYYSVGEITNSNLYSTRVCYPNLSKYFKEDGTFSDIYAASQGAEFVEPMLAIWDSWISYGAEQEFKLSQHASHMVSKNCFRLLYGQKNCAEISAMTSAKWVNTIYVRYAGAPSINAGDDLNLEISSDHTLSANVSSIDETLAEKFKESIRWSSSDESVVKVDAITGKITVVGEGTATITAKAKIDGVEAVEDSITVNVSSDETEDISGAGNGSGTGTGGSGDDKGSGNGTGEEGNNGNAGEITGNPQSNRGTDFDGDSNFEKAEGKETSEMDRDGSDEEQEIKIEKTEDEATVSETGKSVKAIPLKLGSGSKKSEEGSGNSSGGGHESEIVLSMTDQTMWRWTVAFALYMLLLGGLIKYKKYKKEI